MPTQTVGGIFPVRSFYGGPFMSSSGNLYAVAIQYLSGSDEDRLRVNKKSPSVSSWEISFATVGGGSFIYSVWATQLGDVIHIAYVVSNSQVYYATFNMATETMSFSGGPINGEFIDIMSNVTNGLYCSLALLDNGTPVVVYSASEAVMGSSYDRVKLAYKSGGSWTTGVAVSVTGEQQHDTGGVCVDARVGDYVFVFWTRSATTVGYSRRFTNVLSLGNIQQASGVSPGALYGFTPGAAFHSAGNDRVSVGHTIGDGTQVRIFGRFEDDSNYSAMAISTSMSVYSTANGRAYCLADDNDGGMAAAWVDVSNRDLYWSRRRDTDTSFSTPTQFHTGTVDKVNCNVYTKANGDVVIGVVFEEAATLYYDEVLLEAGGLVLPPISPSSPLDLSDDVRLAFTSGITEVLTRPLDNVTSDFSAMGELNIKVEYRVSESIPDGTSLSVRIVSGATVLAAADSGGTFTTIVNSPNNTIDEVVTAPLAYVNASATKAQWDAAEVELKQTSSGAPHFIEVDWVELNGWYLPSEGVSGTSAQTLPALTQSAAGTFVIPPDPATLTLTQQDDDVLIEWPEPSMEGTTHVAIFRRAGTSTAVFSPHTDAELARVPVAITSYLDTAVPEGDYAYQAFPVKA